jgi:hypothetical protein
VREHILTDHPHAKLHVIAIWEPVYAPDASDPSAALTNINPALFNDPRATSFWDPHEISGNWFSHQPLGGLGGGPTVWDAYYAFAPSAHWAQSTLNHLVAAGSTIIGNTDGLEQSFVPLLR